jgi:signal transduction histidine kinase
VRRVEPILIVVVAVALTGVPIALGGWPTGVAEQVGALCAVAGASCLAGWRRHPRIVVLLGPALFLVPLFLGPSPPDSALAFLLAYAALAAERFSGRAAWLAGLACLGYLVTIYAVTGDDSPGLLILTVPGYLAGTAIRLRRETAEQLAERGRELDQERELFAEVTVRNERARIASELHDIVGHALSVMVVQAAAGQRLVDRNPQAARESLEAIAESARQGRADLQRLIELLSGSDVATPDLALVEEMVRRARRSGLRVTCRFEGDRDGVEATVAHVAFRVVQESLTNALRYAPGSPVRVLVRGDSDDRSLTVRVENDRSPAGRRRDLTGTGRGLLGLRERVLEAGGSLVAGPMADGGWRVEAQLVTRPSFPGRVAADGYTSSWRDTYRASAGTDVAL